MKTLALLSIFLVGGYIIAGWHKNGRTPISVSSIAYIFPKGAFSTVMAIYMLLTTPRTFEALPPGWEFVGFLCFAGVLLVAASPYFRSEWRVMHYAGGIIYGILSQVIVAMICPYLLLGWLPLAAYLIYRPRTDTWALWAEITTGLTLALALLI